MEHYRGVTGDFVYHRLKYVTLIYKNEQLVKIAVMKKGICVKLISVR